MNCLLAAATANEIAPFLDAFRENGTNNDIDILITGIGLTASTYSLTRQLTIKKPSLVVQAGIAGSLDKNISLGSVVVVRQDCIGDQAVIEDKQLTTMFDLGLIKPNQAPFRNGLLTNPYKDLMKKT